MTPHDARRARRTLSPFPEFARSQNVLVRLYVRMRDPEQKCIGGWRYVEEEIGSPGSSAQLCIDRAIERPARSAVPAPIWTERLRPPPSARGCGIAARHFPQW
jgi:hypothetical protein